jgi:5-methylcytosine-specific restriction endonuclease McrA
MTGRVLVLNASFEPVNVCTERRAVVMIFKGIARMEEHNGHMLHSARITMHAPSVIRLVEYIHIPYKSRSLSRKNILLRDHSTCQYCGRQFSPSELTLDHVLPALARGRETWDNLVACCKRCNHQKGSRTPEEARDALLAQAARLLAARQPPDHALHRARGSDVAQVSFLRVGRRRYLGGANFRAGSESGRLGRRIKGVPMP